MTLSRWIDQLLHKEPGRRPQGAAEVARALATLVSEGSLEGGVALGLPTVDLKVETEETLLTVMDLPSLGVLHTRSRSTASDAICPNNPTIR